MSFQSVAAVVVTWNRRDLLLEALTAITNQDPAPASVIVVDNASTDGTADVVRERFPEVNLITCLTNTGGAGGFALGIAAGLERGCEVVWLMDDDTVPRPGALAALVGARAAYRSDPADRRGSAPPVVVASRVEWVDGRDHPMNTPRSKPGAGAGEVRAARAVGCVPVRTASFVSILLDAGRVQEVGLPVADFFLWNDDFEYSARVVRGHRALYCPASVVTHKTKVFGGTDADPGERFYFEVRNKVWTLGRSGALSAPERVLYAGATARRWARTIARSRDRPTLLHGLRKGLGDGLRTGPRPTREVLAEARPSHLPEGLAALSDKGARSSGNRRA